MTDLPFEGYDLPERDLPPEYCHYPDEGCELSPSCLCCPSPYCVEDVPRGRQRHRKELRDSEVLRVFHTEGAKYSELAKRFGVSKRTIQRVLSKAKLEKGNP